MKDKARNIACMVLIDIEERGAYSNIKINEYFTKFELTPVDKAFATEIIYGTIRWKLKIDYLIQRNIDSKIQDMDLWTLICLRTAIYQLYFMDKVPDFAAVNEAVELVKTNHKETAAFTNGVLRKILRNREEFYEIGVKNRNKKLSLMYSHPEWLVKKLIEICGKEDAIKLMDINNTAPALTARVNTLKTGREELIRMLKVNGYNVSEGNIPDSIVIEGYAKLERSEEFNEGYFIFQDESSMLPAKVLNPKSGSFVIDLCSAPGGKTTQIAELMHNKGRILAFDIYEHKLKLIDDNADKLGIDIIETGINNAEELNMSFVESADYVLVDAPCSGIGLIRKKPEIRWNIKQQDIEELSMLQRKIILNASQYVKPGGVLVYSTCTLSTEENEDVVSWLINTNNKMKLEGFEEMLPEGYKNQGGNEGYIKIFPYKNNCDGFFIARFRKEG